MNFMGVEVGDAVHLGGVQVVEIQATGGCRFLILAGKRAGAKERAPAHCATRWSTMRGGPRTRDSTM